MVNQYSEVLAYDGGDDFFDEFLQKMHLLDIFKGLLNEFPDKEDFRGVVHFVLWGYSMESDMLTTGGLDWSKLSEKIFKRTGLDKKYYDQVANLESDEVRNSVHRWLQLQNDPAWTQYITYRDLRYQFLKASLIPLPSGVKKKTTDIENNIITDDSDSLNKLKMLVESKMLCATNSKELLVMMQDALQTLVQKHNKLKTSIGALDKASSKKNTATVEDFLHGN